LYPIILLSLLYQTHLHRMKTHPHINNLGIMSPE